MPEFPIDDVEKIGRENVPVERSILQALTTDVQTESDTRNVIRRMFTEAKKKKKGYDGRSGPKFKVLKKNEIPLTDEERAEVMEREATWNHGPNGEPSPAVWKAEVDGKMWYVTATHRAMNVRPTLRGAISRYHRFIKGTS